MMNRLQKKAEIRRKYEAAMGIEDRSLVIPRRFGIWKTRADGVPYIFWKPGFVTCGRCPEGYFPEGHPALENAPDNMKGE